MKLELKHLTPYLPYELKVLTGIQSKTPRLLSSINSRWMTVKYVDENDGDYNHAIYMIKPILRPLTVFDSFQNDLDLTTDFESCYRVSSGDIAFINTSDKTYLSDIVTVSEFMFKNHFDVFGLIPAGLAVSYKEAGLI